MVKKYKNPVTLMVYRTFNKISRENCLCGQIEKLYFETNPSGLKPKNKMSIFFVSFS